MSKFVYSFGIIFCGLALGYVLQVSHRSGRLPLPLPIDDLRKLLQKVALLGLNPVAIVGAIWIVRVRDAALIALPFVGFFALLTGGLLALGAARMLRLGSKQTGAIFGCGSFTNIGSIGALICFVFLGEAGFAMVPIYKIFEEVFYYSIGFPIAKYYSGAAQKDVGVAVRLKALTRDPFILVAVSSLILGALLNLSGLHRPNVYATVNAVVVPLATILLLCSIGLALRFSRVGDYLRECVSVSVIKFMLVPAATSILAWSIGFGAIDNALPLKVVMILSSMPVAFTALIPPSIYDLDLDLANSCWFVTTALLVAVMPLQLIVLNQI
jgi:predicted permease